MEEKEKWLLWGGMGSMEGLGGFDGSGTNR